MASNSSLDLTKASTEAATSFVDAYYAVLANSRSNIEMYYTPPLTSADGTNVPDITWNGNTIPGAAAFQKLFNEEMPAHMHYDVHSVDCQVLNPKYSMDTKIRADRNFSMLVTTSGHLRLEDRKTGPLKDFSETFILVPNVEKANAGAAKGAASRKRDWLIQLQNFRYVVNHQPGLIEGQVTMDVE